MGTVKERINKCEDCVWGICFHTARQGKNTKRAKKKKKRKMRRSNIGITMAENVPALKRQASSNFEQSSIETHIQAYSTEMAEYRVKRKL